MPGVRAFLQLLRIPNVFTAIADVVTGFLFVRTLEDGRDALALALLAGASSALYVSGMVFNDLFDREVDARERPQRPIPSGAVSEGTARGLAWALLTAGLALAVGAGFATGSFIAPIVAAGLSACILLYDGVLKATILGPFVMGGCRGLNVLLGMSAAPQAWSSPAFLTAAAIGVYIAGVTWFARSEADRPNRGLLALGLVVLLGGIAILEPLPSMRAAEGAAVIIGAARWRGFLLLFGALVATRCLSALLDPTPQKTQVAVKSAILSLIVLDAGICFLVAGPPYALGVLTLLIPAMILGRFIYST